MRGLRQEQARLITRFWRYFNPTPPDAGIATIAHHEVSISRVLFQSHPAMRGTSTLRCAPDTQAPNDFNSTPRDAGTFTPWLYKLTAIGFTFQFHPAYCRDLNRERAERVLLGFLHFNSTPRNAGTSTYASSEFCRGVTFISILPRVMRGLRHGTDIEKFAAML